MAKSETKGETGRDKRRDGQQDKRGLVATGLILETWKVGWTQREKGGLLKG